MDAIYRPRVARAVALVAAAYLLYYLFWRATTTLNPTALVFSVIFLLAEAQGVMDHLLFTLMCWDIDRKSPFGPIAPARVDVFVPTYNEPLDVLEATLTGCVGISYPHVTYVLDDGRRPEVAALAERLGCRYLTRGDNQHAKAGNINAALGRTDGEFIVVLDADMVPQPDYLDKTLGYFVDEKVALVQLPQEFYNLDSVQHVSSMRDSGAWHEQQLFYRVIQPGKNRWNAAFWCGSPSVVRRAALESIGGVATESLTEDLLTTIRLHRRGWRTVYHDEVLAIGIAPQTLEAFSVQRRRWAQGTMQVLRSRDNPLLGRGLTLPQRLNYFASMVTYFDALQKLVYILVPSVILVSGMLPLRVNAVDFALHWIPYAALGMATNFALGRGRFALWPVERYNVLKMFTFIGAMTALVWPKGLRFRVTPKQFQGDMRSRDRRWVIPHAVALAVTTAAITLGLFTTVRHLPQATGQRDIVLLAIPWALVIAGMLAAAIVGVVKRLYQRGAYRFPAQFPAQIAVDDERITAIARDMSRYGVGLSVTVCVPVGSIAPVTLFLPDGPLTVEAEVVHRHRHAAGDQSLGLRFRGLTDDDARRIVSYLYVTLPRAATRGVPVPAFQPVALPMGRAGSLPATAVGD